MANIFARSPYIVRIAETGQVGSKLEIWLSATTFSVSPQYTLSKLIPASTNVETLYDISPYIREYISFASCASGGNAAVTNPTNERVNIQLKLYKLVGLVYTQVGSTQTHVGFDGYTYYESNVNFDLSNYALDAGNYYYDPTSDAGKIRVTTGASFTAKYTSFDLVPVINSLAISNGTYDIPRVRTSPNNLLVGNKVEILNAALAVQRTWFFYPQDECKYTPVIIDFVNRYGAWQREFFFKVSNDNFTVENTEYNLMQTFTTVSSVTTYNALEGQRNVFNANAKKSVKVNTGWVNETWSEVLKQIMLSQRILIDNKPAKINTKSTELFKHINTKQINYALEFEFAYDVINSVI